MSNRSTGNGHRNPKSEITLHLNEEQQWVYLVPNDEHPPDPDDVPIFLDETLHTWLNDNPRLRVRNSLGVVQNGQTVAIHLWYDISGQA